VQLTDSVRLLYGFESFHEWLANDVERSREGEGTRFLPEPLRPGQDPVRVPAHRQLGRGHRAPHRRAVHPGCPVTAVFAVNRTTIGAFTSAQLRVSPRLILDGGVRLQAAPELTDESAGYGLAPTLSAAAVYELVPDWHLKVNYAEGFRPPVFNNTNSNGDASRDRRLGDLKVEKSRSGTVEVNAPPLPRQQAIRELDLAPTTRTPRWRTTSRSSPAATPTLAIAASTRWNSSPSSTCAAGTASSSATPTTRCR
jgi:outer membrane receptor protein involved in Fe transport